MDSLVLMTVKAGAGVDENSTRKLPFVLSLEHSVDCAISASHLFWADVSVTLDLGDFQRGYFTSRSCGGWGVLNLRGRPFHSSVRPAELGFQALRVPLRSLVRETLDGCVGGEYGWRC